MEVRPEQPEKQSIDVTELGMVTEVKLVQLPKAPCLIDVTELGMVTEVKLEQPLKARLPIDVTELGMVIEVKPVQL